MECEAEGWEGIEKLAVKRLRKERCEVGRVEGGRRRGDSDARYMGKITELW
jgi:hypothetical protein